MIDLHGRRIRYLRLSVTERCNFRCRYCRPAKHGPLLDRRDILTLEETARLAAIFVELGINRIRLTGGEPLLRRNVLRLVNDLGSLAALDDLSLSTNAFMLPEMAPSLKSAGVRRVNISLDSLTPETFSTITRGGRLERVLKGIDAAVDAGLQPVKINMVVMGGVNSHEIAEMIRYASERGLLLRFIETMPMGQPGRDSMGVHVPSHEILATIRTAFGNTVRAVPGTRGGGPARYFHVEGVGTDIGIISPLSQHFCDTCNRVRLTAGGDLVLCLGRRDRVNLLHPIRQGASDDALAHTILEAISRKPGHHDFQRADAPHSTPLPLRMVSLGG
ncbi:MAG: GTP 3',8-cyclase MoaA [Magnetococcales bacterium]|nr:GTP 3',8-cyclase MoaA [Magnetococcales bacterium]